MLLGDLAKVAESKGDACTHRDSIAIGQECSVRLKQVIRSKAMELLSGLLYSEGVELKTEAVHENFSLEQGYEGRPSCYCLCFQTAFVNSVASVSQSWCLCLDGSRRSFVIPSRHLI